MAMGWYLHMFLLGPSEMPKEIESRKVRNVKKLKVALGTPVFVDYGKDAEILKLKGSLIDTTSSQVRVKSMHEIADNGNIQPIRIDLWDENDIPFMSHIAGEYVVKGINVKPKKGSPTVFTYDIELWRVGPDFAKYFNLMQMLEASD